MSTNIARKASHIKAKRVCSVCGSDTTQIKRTWKDRVFYQYPYWFLNGSGEWMCKTCKYRIDYHDTKKIVFKGKKVYLDENPRIGVCNWCRAVVPFDCMSTQMHHEEYDDSDPLTHTIELCQSCHAKRHYHKLKSFTKKK